MAVTHNAEY